MALKEQRSRACYLIKFLFSRFFTKAAIYKDPTAKLANTVSTIVILSYVNLETVLVTQQPLLIIYIQMQL